MKIIFLILFIFILSGCWNNATIDGIKTNLISLDQEKDAEVINTFSRDSILNNLKQKVEEKKPLVVHILVPLCDNENQGIVPVSASLGNGMNPATNLYWGAAYGMKTYFRRKAEWKTISSFKPDGEVILERIIFQKEYPNGTRVFLVADAYRGDKMKTCLEDFFRMISGKKSLELQAGDKMIQAGSDADMVVFNGHNGLMDVDVSEVAWSGNRRIDAAAIGCYSHSYFKSHFLKSGAYPVLTTTHLMAPEAYVAEALINSWASLSTGEVIRSEAAKAYNTWQKCGMKGAMNLFKSGW